MLHERRLAYQAEALVNYDPIDRTVLANEQVSRAIDCEICTVTIDRSTPMVAPGDLAQKSRRETSSNGSFELPISKKLYIRTWIFSHKTISGRREYY